MAVWVLMFDMRAPDFGAPRGELYRAALDMAAWADERGCAAIVVPEHHFSEDHYLPSPLVMAGALAAPAGSAVAPHAIRRRRCDRPVTK